MPLKANGRHHTHVVSFARGLGERAVITVSPRFAYSLMNGEERMPLGDAWEDAELVLPPNLDGPLTNLLTGEMLQANPQHTLLCREIFATLPVGLLLG
jgi:maltooligosyltrehalose synthase